MLLTTLADTAKVNPVPGPLPADGHGEGLYIIERLVVSPAAGLFTPNPDLAENSYLNVGDVVGWVSDEEVRSPFAGTVMGVMALEGERVTARQPITWLRTH
jgi:[acyl-carrier-protein] S-malonyltransferase